MSKKNNKNDSAGEQSGIQSQDSVITDAVAGDSAAADTMEVDGKKKKSRKPWSTRKKIVLSVVAVVLVALISGGIYLYSIWSNPMGQFQTAFEQKTPEPSESQSQEPGAAPTPTPTVDPYDELVSKADMGFLDHIVNIMLIGVDHSVERDTWNGKKAFHSDVMIVLSINTQTNDVSMISLPRDTYANIPGVDGIYKLNASIDCGGGWPNDSGFQKVCEAAEWMLGDQIPIDYYYAVDMNAVKGLVDTIGGVDFNIDLDFTIQGRSYLAGMQHMDGQAVLDYLRVRKHISKDEAGDLNRINRQKKMLVAIYDKIKKENLLSKIPDILAAFEGNYKTNTSFAQTAALAAFAYQVPSEKIQMYSMGGHYQNIFNWNFVLTDQKARVELIKKIYGIDVKQYSKYASKAANDLWENMQADDIQRKARPILDQVKAVLDADALLPPVPTPTPVPTTDPAAPTPDPAAPTPDPAAPSPAASTAATTDPAATEFAMLSVNNGNAPTNVALEGEQYRKFGDEVWALYNRTVDEVNALTSIDSTDALKAANVQAKNDVQALCSICSVPAPAKGWLKYWRINYETDDNQIVVDFN